MEFDSSYGSGPIQFQLGSGRVIKGWDVGIESMCIGEQRTLVISPDYGYGARGIGPIPADAVLRMYFFFIFKYLLFRLLEITNVMKTLTLNW